MATRNEVADSWKKRQEKTRIRSTEISSSGSGAYKGILIVFAISFVFIFLAVLILKPSVYKIYHYHRALCGFTSSMFVLAYLFIDSKAKGVNTRHRYYLFAAGYAFYIVGIILAVRFAHSVYLLFGVKEWWDKLCMLFLGSEENFKSFTDKIKGTPWLRMGTTLLSGCLLLLTWSRKKFYETWNPFDPYDLGLSKYGAGPTITMVSIVFGAEIAGAYRLAMLAFIIVFTVNVATAYFGHIHITKKLVTALLVEKVVSNLVKNQMIGFCRDLNKVTVAIFSNIKYKSILEQHRDQKRIMDNIMDAVWAKHRSDYDVYVLGVALGYSCVPHALAEDMRPEHVIDMVDRLFECWRVRVPVDAKECEKSFNTAVISGLLLGLIALVVSPRDGANGIQGAGFGYPPSPTYTAPSDIYPKLNDIARSHSLYSDAYYTLVSSVGNTVIHTRDDLLKVVPDGKMNKQLNEVFSDSMR